MASSSETAVPPVYPEDRELIEKLAKVQNMYNQVHNLRGLLPGRLLKPTKAALQNPMRNSPTKLATDLRDTAIQGSKDLRKFATDFRSDAMQQLWQTANSSNCPQGRDAWFFDYEEMLKSSSLTSQVGVLSNDGSEANSPEDVDAVIQRFKEAHAEIVVESAEPPQLFPLHVTVYGLHFRLTTDNTEGQPLYQITQQPGFKGILAQDVVDNIDKNALDQQSLETTLSMLASYDNLRFTTCAKCNRYEDTTLVPHYPVVRKRKPPIDKDDHSVRWLCLHPVCAT